MLEKLKGWLFEAAFTAVLCVAILVVVLGLALSELGFRWGPGR
jgi:hypothetical protein